MFHCNPKIHGSNFFAFPTSVLFKNIQIPKLYFLSLSYLLILLVVFLSFSIVIHKECGHVSDTSGICLLISSWSLFSFSLSLPGRLMQILNRICDVFQVAYWDHLLLPYLTHVAWLWGCGMLIIRRVNWSFSGRSCRHLADGLWVCPIFEHLERFI